MGSVKSEVSYTDFISGRDAESVIHREDESAGWVIGYVEDAAVRGSDTPIDADEYARLATEIQTYNASLDPPEPPAQTQTEIDKARITELEAIGESEWTDAQIRELLAIVGRLTNV
jgi:hypothetical protein